MLNVGSRNISLTHSSFRSPQSACDANSTSSEWNCSKDSLFLLSAKMVLSFECNDHLGSKMSIEFLISFFVADCNTNPGNSVGVDVVYLLHGINTFFRFCSKA